MGGNGSTSMSAGGGSGGSVGMYARLVNPMNLPGQGGAVPGIPDPSNPWPPDASGAHEQWRSADDLQAMLGVDRRTAEEMENAVKDFTGGGPYGEIREAQRLGLTSGRYAEEGRSLEEFIARANAAGKGWTGGTTYRGIQVDNTLYRKLMDKRVGDGVDINYGGTASWSTDRSHSEWFTNMGFGGNRVVFVHTNPTQKMGASAKHLGSSEWENELLVSKDAKFKVTGIAERNTRSGITYIYVDDA